MVLKIKGQRGVNLLGVIKEPRVLLKKDWIDVWLIRGGGKSLTMHLLAMLFGMAQIIFRLFLRSG